MEGAGRAPGFPRGHPRGVVVAAMALWMPGRTNRFYVAIQSGIAVPINRDYAVALKRNTPREAGRFRAALS